MDNYFFDAPQEVHPERLWPLEHGCSGVVYDIGCGDHKTDPAFFGVDIRPITDFVATADVLPFASGNADCVVSRHSFEHFLDPVGTLLEWRRVLKPNGRIYLILPDHGALDTMKPFCSGGVHLHAYTQRSFGNLIGLFPWLRILWLDVVVPNWSFGAILEVTK